MEPCPREYSTEYVRWRASIYRGSANIMTIIGRSISNVELLLFYFVPMNILSKYLDNNSFEDTVNDCLHYTVP